MKLLDVYKRQMAANKPIITSNMKECRRYKSVNIYQTTDQFEVIVEKIMNMTSDESKEYVKILEKDAKDNTWEKRADMICLLYTSFKRRKSFV